MKLALFIIALFATPALAAPTVTITSGGQYVGGSPAVPAPAIKLCGDGVTKVALDAACPAPPPVVTKLTGTASQNGLFRISGTVSGVRISGYEVDTAYRVVEALSGSALHDSVIENVGATDLRRGAIRLRETKNVTIRGLKASYKATPTTAYSELPACIQEEGDRQFGGLVIEDVECDGFQQNLIDATKYDNGDGLNLDSNNPECSVYINRVRLTNASDSGMDVKCPNTTIGYAFAAGNKRNFRFWYLKEAQHLECGDVNKRFTGSGGGACIWFAGNASTYRIRKLTVRFTDARYPIFSLDNPALVVIDECDIQVPAGTVWKVGSAFKAGSSFGPGCRL